MKPRSKHQCNTWSKMVKRTWSGFTNLRTHINNAHKRTSHYEWMLGDTKLKSILSLWCDKNKQRKYITELVSVLWLCNHFQCVTILPFFRQHIKYKDIWRCIITEHISNLTKDENRYAFKLLEIFGSVLDRWYTGNTQYVAILATFSNERYCGDSTELLAMSPIISSSPKFLKSRRTASGQLSVTTAVQIALCRGRLIKSLWDAIVTNSIWECKIRWKIMRYWWAKFII